MLLVENTRWDQRPEDLRRLAVEAPHARTRERFLALYQITQGGCALGVASATERHHQTVLQWVHEYNAHGPDALVFVYTGGRPPFAQPSKRVSTRRSAPRSRSQPRHR